MATYYLGLKYGADMNPEMVTAGTSSAGSGVDVEVRIDTTNGTTREGSVLILQQIIAFIEQGGQGPGGGANLPAT
jgi:hypothetical protein